MMPATTVRPPKRMMVSVARLPDPGMVPTRPAVMLATPSDTSCRFELCWPPVKVSAVTASMRV